MTTFLRLSLWCRDAGFIIALTGAGTETIRDLFAVEMVALAVLLVGFALLALHHRGCA